VGASEQDALGGQAIQARARNPTMPIHPEPAASVMPVHNQQIVASPIAHAHQACPNGNHKGFSDALQESGTVTPSAAPTGVRPESPKRVTWGC
jgi:hypothetical protein